MPIIIFDNMKRILALAFLLVLVAACNSKPEGFTITGKVDGVVADGTQVYLRKTSEK